MDEIESVLLAALPRLRPALVHLGMSPDLDDGDAVSWLRARLEVGWELELEASGVRPR